MWSDSSAAYLTDGGQSSSTSSSLLLFGNKSPTSANAVPTGCDIWSQAKDPVGSLWANPSHTKFVSAASSAVVDTKQKHQISVSDGFNHHPNHNQHTNNNLSNSTAASSCLQLFSDEFQNYLNMIN